MAENKTVLKLSHEVMRNGGGDAGCGFNRRIHGKTHNEAVGSMPHGPAYGAVSAGWELADKMIREGRLYYVHNFHHSHECRGHAFPLRRNLCLQFMRTQPLR